MLETQLRTLIKKGLHSFPLSFPLQHKTTTFCFLFISIPVLYTRFYLPFTYFFFYF